MTLSLDALAVVDDAAATGRSVEVVAFEATASPDARRALWLLSIALVLPPDKLGEITAAIWPDITEPQPAVAEVGSWPLVQREAMGWRVLEGLAAEFAQSFRRAEPDKFVRAHQLLLDRELETEAAERPDESWFIRGRIAYYLAGIEPVESVSSFSRAFADPPPGDRLAARMWLTSLALSQSHLLAGFERDLAFFRGFRAYVTSNFDEALDLLERVLEEPGDDRITATAEHLVGVLIKDEDLGRSIELFVSSLSRSERLGLQAGEVMARNSLAWAHVENGADIPPLRAPELAKAHEYATLNLERARATHDPWLINVCAYSAASIEWLWLSGARLSVDDQARSRAPILVENLRDVSRRALEVTDVETTVFALNDAAQILRDVGDPTGALEQIGSAVATLESAPYVPFIARKLGQTGGSVKSRYREPAVLAEASRVLGRLNALLRRARIERVRSSGVPSRQVIV